MGLDQEIEARRAEIRSDGYPMSIGELISLYRDDELDIHPEFQRFYRWSDEQKSRLIESILLGIPVPSIFVSQREDGVWDVIDGLQRLSTIFELVGILRDEKDSTLEPLILTKTKYLPSLAGKKWEDEDSESSIGSTNRLIIRRSKLDVKIILRESSESSKYEMFQRLNTGGSQLSDQEVRNVILIMSNPEAYRWISELAHFEDFQTCIALSDRMIGEQYDLELATRFLVFRSLIQEELNDVGDVGDFLTDQITSIAEADDFELIRDSEEQAFKFTFSLLANSLSDRSFRKFDVGKDRYTGGFLISAFEPIACGIGFHSGNYGSGNVSQKIEEGVRSLWANPEFLSHSGGGVRASTRLRYNISLGRQIFAP